MIPTRTQIQDKINEAKQAEENIETFVSDWLDSIGCPEENKTKILSDINSYDL